jgi:hypothetical protein
MEEIVKKEKKPYNRLTVDACIFDIDALPCQTNLIKLYYIWVALPVDRRNLEATTASEAPFEGHSSCSAVLRYSACSVVFTRLVIGG